MRLIGDIGGTNARFAVARQGGYQLLKDFLCAEFPSLESCLRAYLFDVAPGERPEDIMLAVAGPVTSDRISLTNNAWTFSRTALGHAFGAARVVIVNDFTANAMALPYLAPADLDQIGGGTAKPEAVKAILGPGTGLGVSGLFRGQDGLWVPVQGEGGHVTMPAANAREAAIIEILRARLGHISAERLLSGDGLVNLYHAIAQLEGRPATSRSPAQITDPAIGDSDPSAQEAVAMFCAALGTVAGDVALTLGAFGGVYIAGGIVPRLGARFAQSEFRPRFEAKGRLRDYVAAIPTFLITHKSPALVGLSHFP